MPLPFVSRERLVEAQERIKALEAENKRLTEMLLERLQKPAPFSLDQKDLSAVQPIPGRPTIANVIGEANRAAYQNAQTPGAKSIATDLAERAGMGWKQ
jgi:hypothetical protein